MKDPGSPPHWHAVEQLGGTNLHCLIARLGRSPASVTTYRLGDGLRHLADLDAADLPIGQGTLVEAVTRTHDGYWRLHVRCIRCGELHVHDGGAAVAPRFGPQHPSCGGEPYHIRIDSQ